MGTGVGVLGGAVGGGVVGGVSGVVSLGVAITGGSPKVATGLVFIDVAVRVAVGVWG